MFPMAQETDDLIWLVIQNTIWNVWRICYHCEIGQVLVYVYVPPYLNHHMAWQKTPKKHTEYSHISVYNIPKFHLHPTKIPDIMIQVLF